MKKLFSIVLFVLLTWQTLFKSGIIVYWKINQNYISQNLCENRNKPAMHCCGKCYLKKQLSKIETNSDKEKNTPISILKTKSLEHFILPAIVQNRTLFAFQYKVENYKKTFYLLDNYFSSIYHPPELI